jgi:hypothetical protein
VSVTGWLLDGDSAVRWQVLRDLTDAPPEVVRSKRQPDGRWLLDRVHPGRVHFDLEGAGMPSRWNTLRALRVLKWWDGCLDRDGAGAETTD